MKKRIGTALAAVALSVLTTALVPTVAQAGPVQGRAHRGAGLKKMAGALGLTDAQKAQMQTILAAAKEQAKAIKQDTTLAPDAKNAKMRELRKSTMLQMRGVLTPDQIAKMKALRRNRRNSGKA